MAQFLPHDAMRKRHLCCRPVFVRLSVRPSVRPSVYLSVTFVYCIQTAEDIVKLLCQSGSPCIILVFLTTSADTKIQGNPFIGGVKHGAWKNSQRSTEIAIYLGLEWP